MRLPDINVLVHAVNSASPVHEKAARWLREAIETGDGLALAWVALLGFVRISTRPGIYAEPLSTDRALTIVHRWLHADAARVVHPGPRHAILLGEFLRRAGTAGNLSTDAHLAALAMEHGAVVGTFDRDFVRFDGLRVDRLTPS